MPDILTRADKSYKEILRARRARMDEQVSTQASDVENQSESHILPSVTTPETIHISLPALRSVILAVIDDGDPTTTLDPAVLPALPWGIDHPFQDVANDARERKVFLIAGTLLAIAGFLLNTPMFDELFVFAGGYLLGIAAGIWCEREAEHG